MHCKFIVCVAGSVRHVEGTVVRAIASQQEGCRFARYVATVVRKMHLWVEQQSWVCVLSP